MLHGKRILITAGPTYERIDPVRFVGNFSTGKMGFALADICVAHGAEVVLIAGPVQLSIDNQHVSRIDVVSADDMFRAVIEHFPACDGAIFCAAVADFTPISVANQKLKREGENLILTLKPTRDIAAEVGKMKSDRQFLAGFALETNDEEAHALEKMRRKNFDMIVLNSLNDPNACFGFDTNKVTILTKTGEKTQFPLKSKREVAEDIVSKIENLIR